MFAIPTADSLVTYLKDFTGSTNDNEIKQCIFNNELAMRNIELPSLRSDPYTTTGTVGNNQLMPIPSDMNKPILFFMQGPTGSSTTITATCTGAAGVNLLTITNNPNQPLQVGQTVSGTGIGAGALISYFPSANQIVLTVNNTAAVNGTITFGPTQGTVHGTGPWIVFDRIGDRDIISQSLLAWNYLSPANVPAVIRGKFSEVGQNYQFLPLIGAGSIINMYYYRAWDLLFTPVYDGATQVGTVQTNPVLQSWPEGYVYGSLHEYYVKRRSADDSAMYKQKFIDAWKTVEDQNSLGKWSGGHTRLTSIFQPRRAQQYSVK
jgi:hypothetical protein